MLSSIFIVSRDRSYYFAIKLANTQSRIAITKTATANGTSSVPLLSLNYTYNYAISYCCVSHSLNISEKGDFELKCMPEVDDTQFESMPSCKDVSNFAGV